MTMSIENFIGCSCALALWSDTTQSSPKKLDAEPGQYDPPTSALTIVDDAFLCSDCPFQSSAFRLHRNHQLACASDLLRFARKLGVGLVQRNIGGAKRCASLRDNPVALPDEMLEMMDVRGLTIQCSVAVMKQRIEPQHFTCLRLDTAPFAIVAVAEQRQGRCRRR